MGIGAGKFWQDNSKVSIAKKSLILWVKPVDIPVVFHCVSGSTYNCKTLMSNAK